MKKSTRIWLWTALALSAGTTALNGFYGRWPSVVIAVAALIGLCLLLFREKKSGYGLLCICSAISCLVGIFSGIADGTNPAAAILMSLIGALLIPVVTAVFLRGQWQNLN